MNQTDNSKAIHIPKVLVICNQGETAPVWGYILRQQGLNVIIETSTEKAINRWAAESPDLVIIDIDVIFHLERMELFRKIRAASTIPVLFLLPAYHETQMLEAYAAGVDEVVVKPVSPPIFLAKIMSWINRSRATPVHRPGFINVGKYRLNPTQKSLIDPELQQIELTNLEFRLLNLLMSRPGHIFKVEELVQAIWGEYSKGDHILLKNVVYRLRKKVETDPSKPLLLQTSPGGYSFQG